MLLDAEHQRPQCLSSLQITVSPQICFPLLISSQHILQGMGRNLATAKLSLVFLVQWPALSQAYKWVLFSLASLVPFPCYLSLSVKQNSHTHQSTEPHIPLQAPDGLKQVISSIQTPLYNVKCVENTLRNENKATSSCSSLNKSKPKLEFSSSSSVFCLTQQRAVLCIY